MRGVHEDLHGGPSLYQALFQITTEGAKDKGRRVASQASHRSRTEVSKNESPTRVPCPDGHKEISSKLRDTRSALTRTRKRSSLETIPACWEGVNKPKLDLQARRLHLPASWARRAPPPVHPTCQGASRLLAAISVRLASQAESSPVGLRADIGHLL